MKFVIGNRRHPGGNPINPTSWKTISSIDKKTNTDDKLGRLTQKMNPKKKTESKLRRKIWNTNLEY